jgi:hypothetical protein
MRVIVASFLISLAVFAGFSSGFDPARKQVFLSFVRKTAF